MPINLFVILATNDKNISELEINSIIRNAKLIERYKKDIINGNRKDLGREPYALVFEALVLKYLPKVKTQKEFKEKARFATDKTFKKFVQGKYCNIAELDSRILIQICLGLTFTREESYDFFYVCGQNLYIKDDNCTERRILDKLIIPLEELEGLSEQDRNDKIYINIYKANKIFKKDTGRGLYVNCPREEQEAKEICEELDIEF